jgi:hypothetical protein
LLYVAGIEDRLVTESSLHEVKQEKPDALVARIDAPHLLLQAKPREAVDALISFLKQVGTDRDQEIAGA